MHGPKSIEQPHVLLVEGRDDELFFRSFLKSLNIGGVQVLSVGGRDNLRPHLLAVSNTPGFGMVRALGLVRDADESSAAAFESMKGALAAVGFPVPDRPFEIARSEELHLQTSVLVMPGSTEGFGLESLCLASVSDEPVMSCIDAFFECLHDKEIRWSNNAAEEKARLQAFLATRERPGLRLGEAAEKRIWPWEARAFSLVRETLRGLFSEIP